MWFVSEPPPYQSSEGQHVEAADRYQYQPGPGCTPQELMQVPSGLKRAAQARDCANQAQDHRREVDDLTQQTRAAEAVERANWTAEANYRLSRLQLILSALGAGGLLYTLYLTRQTTRVAQEANTIAIKAAELDARPWLHVEIGEIRSASIDRAKPPEEAPLRFSAIVDVTIKNTGKTPARNVFIQVAACDDEGAMALVGAAYDPEPGEDFQIVGAVAPNAEAFQDFPIALVLDGAPTGQYFTFGARLMCIIRYADAISGSRASPLRTIQHFIIENRIDDRLGTYRTIGLSSRSIEAGTAKLTVRPAVGEMT